MPESSKRVALALTSDNVRKEQSQATVSGRARST